MKLRVPAGTSNQHVENGGTPTKQNGLVQQGSWREKRLPRCLLTLIRTEYVGKGDRHKNPLQIKKRDGRIVYIIHAH